MTADEKFVGPYGSTDPEHPYDCPDLNAALDEARAMGVAPSQRRRRAAERRLRSKEARKP